MSSQEPFAAPEEEQLSKLLVDVQQQAEKLALLGEVRAILARETELSVITRTVVEATAHTFGYTQVSLYLLEDETLVCQHQVGYPQPVERMPITHGVLGRVARTGQPALLRDVRSDPVFLPSMEGIISELCVPLFDGGTVVGTLKVESTTRELNQDDLRLILALSEQVNVAITSARLFAEVRKSEERFRLLSEATSEGISIHERGRIVLVNPAYARMFGYEVDELVGRSVLDVVAPEWRSMVLKHIQEGYTKPYESVALRKDGSTFHVEASSRSMPYHGRMVRGTAVRDISERKRSEQDLRRHAEQMAALHATALAITASQDLPTLLHKIVTSATQLLSNSSGALYLCDPEGEDVRRMVSTQALEEDAGLTLKYGEGGAGTVAQTGQPLNIADYSTWSGRGAPSEGERAKIAVLCVPMIWQGQVMGVLEVTSSERRFSQDDVQLLSLYADQAAIAVENARLYNELQHMATTDELTGIYNRHQLFKLGQQELARAQRFAHPLSALMLDIDHFKDVNDQYGHGLGDQVLRAVAQRSLKAIRAVDVLGRYGGEEFVILLPETSIAQARNVAERLREEIAHSALSTADGDIHVTVSLGVARANGEARDLRTLLDQADRALYAAKQAGRNRVEIWNEGE